MRLRYDGISTYSPRPVVVRPGQCGGAPRSGYEKWNNCGFTYSLATEVPSNVLSTSRRTAALARHV